MAGKIKYRTFRRRILKLLEKEMLTIKKYNKLRTLFAKLFSHQFPVIKEEKTAKEKIENALPAFRKVLYDEETSILFKQYMSESNYSVGNTDNFLQFLEKISNGKS